MLLPLSNCASYRKREITIEDSSGKPAAGREVRFDNIVPAPFIPPIRNASGILDEKGSAMLLMPVTTGRLALVGEGSILLTSDQVIEGVSDLELDRHPNPLFPGITVAASEWRATISKR